jgi:hypothetical protein
MNICRQDMRRTVMTSVKYLLECVSGNYFTWAITN